MHTELSAEQQSYLKRLAVPFHPDAINWRVTNKSRDGRRGCVIPYGDQRAYTDRLNEIVTPAGWTRKYEVTTLSPVTRVKKDKAIQTGKVIVTCVVSIHGLGSHSGSGEMWADDDNAMTRAEVVKRWINTGLLEAIPVTYGGKPSFVVSDEQLRKFLSRHAGGMFPRRFPEKRIEFLSNFLYDVKHMDLGLLRTRESKKEGEAFRNGEYLTPDSDSYRTSAPDD